MKKIILILLLILLSTSCNKYITKNIYERTYRTEQEAVFDISKQFFNLKLSEVSLDQWITNTYPNPDTIQVTQKIYIKNIDKKIYYQFILTKYTYPSIVDYNLLIRYNGKKLKK